MKTRILLVDDDPAICEMLGRLLTEEGYEVLAASNGQTALELVEQSQVELVLLDLNLPVKSGWDTFDRLTAERPELPVVIITARPNQLFTALGAGAGALMEKPLDFPNLLRTIRALLDEPAETRLARLAGKSVEFHYTPPRQLERRSTH